METQTASSALTSINDPKVKGLETHGYCGDYEDFAFEVSTRVRSWMLYTAAMTLSGDPDLGRSRSHVLTITEEPASYNNINNNANEAVRVDEKSARTLSRSSRHSRHHVMFADGHFTDPVRENMAYAISSIFFCCILGLMATIKASEALDYRRQADDEKSERASAQARKLAMTAFAVGLALYFTILFTRAFFLYDYEYGRPRLGHYHVTRKTHG